MKKSNKTDGRPSFQFYPDDWLSDSGLRLCSLEARGLWMDMICHMWYSGRRGYLVIDGRPMTAEDISKLVAKPSKACQGLLAELQRNAVNSVTEDGIIYCRRMAREEDIRQKRARAGSLGGLAKAKHDNIAKSTPSSPASSSTPPSILKPKQTHEPKSTEARPQKTDDEKESNPDVKTFVDWWHKAFKDKTGAPYLFTGKDFSLIKTLVETHQLDAIKKYATTFLESPDDFAQKNGLTIGIFYSQINRISSAGSHDPYFDGYKLSQAQIAAAIKLESSPKVKAYKKEQAERETKG